MSDKLCNSLSDDLIDIKDLIDTKDLISPSGRYKLITYYYRSSDNTDYMKAIIINIESNKVINEAINEDFINNCRFISFFNKDSYEWLVSSYLDKKYECYQYFHNIDTGKTYVYSSDNNFWVNVKTNPDGKILFIETTNCYNDHELQFFDFSDPNNGCLKLNILSFSGIISFFYINYGYNITWNDNNTCQITQFCNYSVQFRNDIEDLSDGEIDQLDPSDCQKHPKYLITLTKEEIEGKEIEGKEIEGKEIEGKEIEEIKGKGKGNNMKVIKIVNLLHDDV